MVDVVNVLQVLFLMVKNVVEDILLQYAKILIHSIMAICVYVFLDIGY